MVEEKKKRGRPRKINAVTSSAIGVLPRVAEATEARTVPNRDQSYRRDELVVQMIMGIINKQGTIKYDLAKDLFNTATQLSYDFGWMEKPKEKKKNEDVSPLLDPVFGFGAGAVGDPAPVRSDIITPADAFRAVRGDS